MSTPPAVVADTEQVTRLRMAVMRLARRLRQNAEAGITPSQLSALFSVEHRGPLTLGELAAIEEVQPPSVTRIVAALETAGLVARREHEADRRSVVVEVTPEGKRAIAAVRRQRNAWLAQRLAGLDEAEAADVERAVAVLERLVGQEP